MNINLSNVGKRYGREWIFRNITYEFQPATGHVILGANGSGKSTLLQVIAGNILTSEGTITYSSDNGDIPDEDVFRHLSFASPYLELIEEFTLKEAIEFHFAFKPVAGNKTANDVIRLMDLEKAKEKPLKYFSSGMKQRVKLGLAILSDTNFLLLDEPLINLDKAGKEWYKNLILNYTKNRLVIVCSNDQKDEYFFCEKYINIEDFKGI